EWQSSAVGDLTARRRDVENVSARELLRSKSGNDCLLVAGWRWTRGSARLQALREDNSRKQCRNENHARSFHQQDRHLPIRNACVNAVAGNDALLRPFSGRFLPSPSPAGDEETIVPTFE